jgi:hypothetical protein
MQFTSRSCTFFGHERKEREFASTFAARGNILVTRGTAPELRHASGLRGLRNLGNTPLKRDQLGLMFGTLLTISTLQL